MIVLGLDTTGADCTAALVDEGRMLAQKSEHIGRGHAERLAPMVQEILSEAQLNARQVDKLCVCTGPGSFTGLRVALAFAKGFALPGKLPIVGLDALAIAAAQTDPEATKNIVALCDVRRGELCWAAIFKGERVQSPITQKAETARAAIQALTPDLILQNVKISGPILAWLGYGLSPENYPARPFYSRPPDAKLSGTTLSGAKF